MQTAIVPTYDEMIKQVLSAKFLKLREFFPTSLHDLLLRELFFAGGAIVDLVNSETPKDYDLFVKTEEGVKEIKECLNAGKGRTSFNMGGVIKARTENAITLIHNDGTPFQIITRFFGPTDRIFKDFDFEHTKSFYDLEKDLLIYNADIILNKKLIYTGEKDKYSLNTLKRLVKFTNRGWKVDNQSLINLHKACAKNDLNDPEVMRELAAGFYGSSLT